MRDLKIYLMLNLSKHKKESKMKPAYNKKIKIEKAINKYMQEHISIAKASKLTNISISEFMDLLDNFSIKNNKRRT